MHSNAAAASLSMQDESHYDPASRSADRKVQLSIVAAAAIRLQTQAVRTSKPGLKSSDGKHQTKNFNQTCFGACQGEHCPPMRGCALVPCAFPSNAPHEVCYGRSIATARLLHLSGGTEGTQLLTLAWS